MKDNLKIRAVLGDNDSTMLSELQVLLNEELSRDEGQRDYDYISELTLAIAEISGASLTDDEVERNIGSIMEEVSSREKRSHITVVRRVLSAVCSVALFFAAINCVTLASFGADVFSTFVKLTNGGFIIDFSNTENTGSGVVPAPVTEEAMPSEANNNTRPTAEGGVPGAVVQTDENVPTNYPTQAAAVIRPGVDGTNNSGEVPAGTEANVPSTKGTGGNSGGSGYVSVGRIMRERCSAQGLSPAAHHSTATAGHPPADPHTRRRKWHMTGQDINSNKETGQKSEQDRKRDRPSGPYRRAWRCISRQSSSWCGSPHRPRE